MIIFYIGVFFICTIYPQKRQNREFSLEFLTEYGLFLAKTFTVIAGIGILVAIIAGASQKTRQGSEKGQLEINPLNDQYDDIHKSMSMALLDPSLQKAEAKKLRKEQKKQNKLKQKQPQSEVTEKKHVFVLKFNGNVSASAVTNLREEITAILTQATGNDEVVVKLESSGDGAQLRFGK